MFTYHLIDDYLTHVKVSSYMDKPNVVKVGDMFGGGE